MKFMILMSADPSWDALSASEQAEIVEAHGNFESDLVSSGSYVDSGRFGPDIGRAIEQNSEGGKQIVPNPDPGKGLIGGFYLIDVADIDEALSWADRCRFITGTNWVYSLWE